MSVKQFESFLAEQFIKWAENSISAGFRYQFRSPSFENSDKLYQALCHVELAGFNRSQVHAGDVELAAIECGGFV